MTGNPYPSRTLTYLRHHVNSYSLLAAINSNKTSGNTGAFQFLFHLAPVSPHPYIHSLLDFLLHLLIHTYNDHWSFYCITSSIHTHTSGPSTASPHSYIHSLLDILLHLLIHTYTDHWSFYSITSSIHTHNSGPSTASPHPYIHSPLEFLLHYLIHTYTDHWIFYCISFTL